MAKLIYVPLGCSLRPQLAEELSRQSLGEGVLVLPNRLLMDEVRRNYPNVETMGMDTLASKLMNINGGTDYKELSRRSQELIVQDIIDYMMENKQLTGMKTHKQLEYFGSLAHKTGFVKAMTSLVSQLSRCGATKEDIYGQMQKSFEEDELKGKDLGVCNFYLLYRQYLEDNKWYDLEGKYRLAVEKLKKQDCKIPWKHIYISDFFSLDQVQVNFLQALAKHVDDLVISMSYEGRRVSIDEKAKYESITKFMRASTNTVNSLKILGAMVESLAAEELQQAPAAAAMQQLRRLGHAPAPVPLAGVESYCFASDEQEMRWVLKRIKHQLAQKQCAANRIVVAVRDFSLYSGLRQLADEYGVPVSLPQTTALVSQPLAVMLRLLLTAAGRGREAAVAYLELLDCELLRLFFDVDVEVASSLRSQTYFKTRQQAMQKAHELLGDATALWQQLDAFIENTQAEASISDYAEQLTQLVQSLPLEERLGSLHKQGVPIASLLACLRSKDAVLKAVQQLVHDYDVAHNLIYKLTLSQWNSLLQEALGQVQLTLSFGRRDGVLFTEVGNVQGLSFDSVYIMGLREGEFPQAKNENWIYNDTERKQLADAGYDLPTVGSSFDEDAYFFAQAVCAAQRELILTWHEEVGESLASSYLDEIWKLFLQPGSDEKRVDKDYVKAQTPPDFGIASAEEAYSDKRFAAADLPKIEQLSGQQAPTAELQQAAQADTLRKAQQVEYNGDLQSVLPTAMLQKKIGSRFSASRLEVYAACPFRFLAEKVWLAQAAEAADDLLQPRDAGDILHQTLKSFVEPYLGSKIIDETIEDLTEELEAVFEDVCTAARNDNSSAIASVNEDIWQVEKQRLWRMLLRWLRFEYADQQRWGGFTPYAVEWDFSSKNGKPLYLTLSDGSEASLIGRIDRIDSDGEHAFITDYKSGSAPSSKAMAQGLDLQLPVYLLAAALAKEQLTVSGGCYYSLKEGKRKSAFLLESVGNSDLPYKKPKNTAELTWDSFKQEKEQLLKDYIERIYAGDFALAGCRRCDVYCPLHDICRIQLVSGANEQGGESDE